MATLLMGFVWPSLASAAAPTVTGISPASGPAAGGTEVTVVGSGFTADSTVSFGGAVVTPTSVSDTSLTVASPAAAAGAGTVDVTVTGSGGTSATGPADQFTYLPVPVVTAVSPSTGPPGGGTTVTITGTGFIPGATVLFGGTNVSATVVSSTSLTAVSPPGTGAVDIVVVTAGGSSPVSPVDLFTYSATTTTTGHVPPPTGGGSAVPPSLAVAAASGVSATGATLTGTVASGSAKKITHCRFQYGTSGKFTRSVPCRGHAPGTVHATLIGLVPGTTYQYRLAVSAPGLKLTASEPMSFTTTPQLVVGAPRVGLLLAPIKHSRYIAQLVGIKGITGGTLGESLVLRCVKGCEHKLSATIPLRKRADLKRKIGLSQALLLTKATRIDIDLSADGKLSQFASYQFYVARGLIAVKIAKTGCIRGTTVVQCPSGILA